MKRFAVALAVIGAISLVGCESGTRSIEGSVETVIEECQDIPTDAENVSVKVSGEPSMTTNNVGGSGISVVFLAPDSTDTSVSVICYFEDADEETMAQIADLSGRVTITGTLVPSSIEESTVSIEDCEIV